MLNFYDKDKKEILFEDQRTFCKNPTCLGEPWCSAWGICKNTKTMEIDELFKELNENIVAESVSNLLPPSSIPSEAQETPLHSARTTARHISKSDKEEEQAKESRLRRVVVNLHHRRVTKKWSRLETVANRRRRNKIRSTVLVCGKVGGAQSSSRL